MASQLGKSSKLPARLLRQGKCADRIVAFLPDGLPVLVAGMQREIFEGPQKLIGRGTVLELLEAKCQLPDDVALPLNV